MKKIDSYIVEKLHIGKNIKPIDDNKYKDDELFNIIKNKLEYNDLYYKDDYIYKRDKDHIEVTFIDNENTATINDVWLRRRVQSLYKRLDNIVPIESYSITCTNQKNGKKIEFRFE